LGLVAMQWAGSWAIRVPIVIVCWMLGDFIGERLDKARQKRSLGPPKTGRPG
jgi:hypothetical protein